MKRILIVLFALALAGCASITNPISPTTAYDLRGAYVTGFLVPAGKYNRLPRCAAGQVATFSVPCSDRAIVAKLRAADQKAKIALDELDNFSGQPSVTAMSAAQAAVGAAIKLILLTKPGG